MVLSQSPNSIGYINDNTQLVANISVPRCHAFEIPHSPSCQLSNPFSCQQMRASFTNDNQHQCIARTVSERASSFGDDDQFMPSRKKRVRLVKDNEDDDHEMDLSSPCSSRSSYPSLPLSPTVPSTRSTSAHLSSEDHVLIEMIQKSGAKSQSDIAKFCLSAGIPISRMLRLDLLRQSTNA